MSPYRVAITGENANPDGSTIYGDIGLERLEQAGLSWEVLPKSGSSTVSAAELEGFNALFALGHYKVGADSIRGLKDFRHVARFGAGYDAVDIPACTEAGVVVTNAPEAVRKPMAQATIALLFALAHNLVIKDKLVRTGRWNEKQHWRGAGLDGATIGLVGLGGIGESIARDLKGLGLKTVAYNRSPKPGLAAELGVDQKPLADVLAESDFVIVTVAANSQTRHLIGEEEFALMKPGAFLINVARGSIVDEQALIRHLQDGHLGGAALDVFETEPLPETSPLIGMENVVLAPHGLCWTKSFTDAVSTSAIKDIIAVSRGERPIYPVNPEVLKNP
ncbi:2-hydroxyacid dehydrogenase [Arthrobacter monumenti]